MCTPNGRQLMVFIVCLAYLYLVSPAHSSLIGDEVTASITGGGVTWDTETTTVSDGLEYSLPLTNVTFTANLGADSLLLTYRNTSPFPNITILPQSFLFEDLDWVGMSGRINGLNEEFNSFPQGITPTFTDDSITLNVALTSLNPNQQFSALYSIDAEEQSKVPIPSTLLFFGLGFAGFAAWRHWAEKIETN